MKGLFLRINNYSEKYILQYTNLFISLTIENNIKLHKRGVLKFFSDYWGELQYDWMKISLTIPTGRPRVKHVTRAFVENAIQHGHDPGNISVYLSIDTTYKRTRVSDFYLHPDLESILAKVEYISPKDRKNLGDNLVSEFGLDPFLAKSLFSGRGYSRQRNSALLSALRDGNDVAICFDDDEAPYIPVEQPNGKVEWYNLDFFGPHLMMLQSGADITRGPCFGYVSPIPSGIEKNVPERIRRRLGEVLTLGNEVIDEDSFLHLIEKVGYLPVSELNNPTRPFTAEQTPFGKTIYSGNMAINLNSVRNGRIPLFYTPPNARGEDTIFSLQLSDANVVEVPSYIFHDPFVLYPQVLKGNFPSKLRTIPVTRKSIERFADAVIGWLKYAPILIYMSSTDEKEKESRIKEMIDKIEAPTNKLADLLRCPRLRECKDVLEEYQDNVISHYDTLIRAQRAWQRIIIPAYSQVSV